MIVRIYDFLSAEKPKFSENLVGIVSDVTKFKYTRRAYDIGSFEMEIPTHADDAEYIQPDRMLIVGEKLSETYISGDPTRRIVNGTFLYVTEVDKNDQTITVTGYDLKYLFASRVTLFPAEEQDKGTYGYYVVSGTTFSCISNLINYNIINATDSDRQIFGMSAITMPTTQVDAGLTGIQDDRYMTRLEPLSTAIFNLLKNCKTHFYDVRLLIDDNADDADNYNPHLESSEDKPTIIIDESRYNIKSYTRKDGTSAYKNAIYAVSGTGDDVVVKCVKREGDTASGIKRKEVVLDVDTDSVSEIDRYAIKAAEDYNISDDFEIEPLFDDDDAEPTLAQKVLICIDGVDYETVITEITDEYSDGKHTQSYVCGDKKLKVLNVLNKATAGNTQKIINNKISVGKIENAIGDLIVSSPKVELLFDNQTLENSGTGNNTVESVGTDEILYGAGRNSYCYSPTNHSQIRISGISFDSFTIMCWFKAEKDGLSPYSQWRRLFYWANLSGNLCDIEFDPQKTGKIYAICDADYIVETNKAYNDGDWHLAIYRKLGGSVIVDIDNERMSFINKLSDIKNGEVYISKKDYSFNGYIDSFAIFDKYLSDSEINSYKNGSKYRLSYNDLSDKPKINGVIITDDKLPDDLGLAAKEHNHTVANITDMPDWAKQPAKPTYTASEVGAAAKKHTHAKSDITDFPASLPANGGDADTVDGKHASDFAADITAAVNAVSIGGRNIVTGTAAMSIGVINSATWKNGQWRKSGTGDAVTIDIADPPIPSISKGVRFTQTTGKNQIGIVQDKVLINSNTVYTLSCWARSNSADGVTCRLQPFFKTATDNGGYSEIIVKDSWQKISFTAIRPPQTTAEYSCAYIYLQPTGIGNYIDVCAIKFEAGNKVTDWSPAPEDDERRIASLEARVAALEAAALAGGE